MAQAVMQPDLTDMAFVVSSVDRPSRRSLLTPLGWFTVCAVAAIAIGAALGFAS
jgi:hypothetical protein